MYSFGQFSEEELSMERWYVWRFVSNNSEGDFSRLHSFCGSFAPSEDLFNFILNVSKNNFATKCYFVANFVPSLAMQISNTRRGSKTVILAQILWQKLQQVSYFVTKLRQVAFLFFLWS
jgi:hypothetical protein